SLGKNPSWPTLKGAALPPSPKLLPNVRRRRTPLPRSSRKTKNRVHFIVSMFIPRRLSALQGIRILLTSFPRQKNYRTHPLPAPHLAIRLVSGTLPIPVHADVYFL